MESIWKQSVRIAVVVCAYWFVSISMVFMNKYLLSSKDLKLDAPMFVTWFQCVVTVALCGFFSALAKLFPSVISFPEFSIDIKILRQVLPLSIVFVSMITFNNLCLKYVGVAFYYIGRSLTTVFNVVFTYFFLQQKTSLKALACCAVIVGGFFLGVDQESASGAFSLIGVLFGVMASASVAMYSIYIKKVLPVVNQNVWRLALYNNVNACILFLPLMLAFNEVSEVVYFPHLLSPTFWIAMTLSGVFGFAIGYVTGLQIQVTSPLTHNISGTAKACAQTIIATTYYNDVKTSMWWVSNAVVLFGSCAYTHVKRSEMKQQHMEEMNKMVEHGVKEKNGTAQDIASKA